MNNIQEDDWGDDSWSRHSGMPYGDEPSDDTPSSISPAEKVCPLCGKPNLCKAGSDLRCWCFDTPVPKDLLATLPDEARGKSCICEECIVQWNNSKKS